MIDAQSAAILQKHVRLTGRSLLQYIDESFPWTRGKDSVVLLKLKEMLNQERQIASSITRFLYKNRFGTPYLGQYPVHFTTLNFLSVGRLLALLVEYQQQDVEELESDLGQVEDVSGELLEKMLGVKRANLENIIALSNPPSATSEEGITRAEEAASA